MRASKLPNLLFQFYQKKSYLSRSIRFWNSPPCQDMSTLRSPLGRPCKNPLNSAQKGPLGVIRRSPNLRCAEKTCQGCKNSRCHFARHCTSGCQHRQPGGRHPTPKLGGSKIWLLNQKIGDFTLPKWMVKIVENPIKMDDLGGKHHYFWETPICIRNFWSNFKHETPTFCLIEILNNKKIEVTI